MGFALDRFPIQDAPTLVSQSERDLVAIISGAPLAPRSPRTPEDSAAFLRDLLTAWQILPSITEEQMVELGSLLLETDYTRLRNARLAVTAFAKTQVAAGRDLLRTLEESGLDYCLLKGSATGHLLYAQPHMRGAWDLDLGVPASALGQAEAIANACGYVAAQQDAGTGQFHLADPRLKAKVESEHYELGFLVRRLQVTNLSPETREAIRTEPFARKYWFDVEGDAPYCYASVDIHHAISHDIPLVDLLGKSREISYDDFKVRVPSETWLLFHLVFKIYWEGVHNYRKGLYEYADLIRLMRNIDPSTIGELSEILQRHNLLAAGYYVLRRLPHFGYSPGPEVLGFLARTADPGDADDAIRLNDLGDMWPKMWGRR